MLQVAMACVLRRCWCRSQISPESRSPMAVRDHPTPEELLRRTYYSPEELAELLEMSPYFIREEARQRRLKAVTVDHNVLYIRRDDVLDWLHRISR
nr:MAG: hypothetical protein DIU58_14915 [Sphaerobacter thermophilus]